MSAKGIILAAGRGSRLYPFTLQKPKCMLEVGGMRIIDRQIEALRRVAVDDVVIVVGYERQVIMTELGPAVRYRTFDDFDKTNNLHTLWSVRDELDTDFFCLFADVIFEPEILMQTNDCQKDFCMVVDTSKVLDGTMRVRLEGDRVIGIGDQIPSGLADGNFIGIARIRERGARDLVREMGQFVTSHRNDFYTIAIDSLARKGATISYVDVRGKFWTEIDTKEDLENARARVTRSNVERGGR